MDPTHTACGLVEEDCLMVAGTRPPRQEKTRMDSAVVESTATHTRLMWGVEDCLEVVMTRSLRPE